MITLFTCPKAFTDKHNATIQRNAISSWRHFGKGVEVILLGDDTDVDKVANEYGLIHIPLIERNSFGTPLLSDIFQKAQAKASHPMVCYINSDIILGETFFKSVKILNQERKFLAVGRRKTIKCEELIDWNSPTQVSDVWEKFSTAEYDAVNAIDFFIFNKGMIQMKPFAIGRPAWDNWTLWHCRQLGIKVIDTTEDIDAVHQFHGYGHVKNRQGTHWEGPEAEGNRKLAGGYRCMNDLRDVSHLLVKGKVKKAQSITFLKRRIYQQLRKIKHFWKPT